MKKRNGKESRFPFTSVILGMLFGYLHQATAIGKIIGIPDLGLYISLGFFSIATLQVLLGKSKQKRESNARFRNRRIRLDHGDQFPLSAHPNNHRSTDSWQNRHFRFDALRGYRLLRPGISVLSANLNKLLKKQGTHFRNGVLGALFGTVFLFLTGKRWPAIFWRT